MGEFSSTSVRLLSARRTIQMEPWRGSAMWVFIAALREEDFSCGKQQREYSGFENTDRDTAVRFDNPPRPKNRDPKIESTWRRGNEWEGELHGRELVHP
jgi:hypothetical protein